MDVTKKVVKIIVTVLLLLLAVPTLAALVGAVSVNNYLRYGTLKEIAVENGWANQVRDHIRAGFAERSYLTGYPEYVTDAFLEESVTDEICLRFWDENPAPFPTNELTADLASRLRAYAVEARAKGEITLSDKEWELVEANFTATAREYVAVAENCLSYMGSSAYVSLLSKIASGRDSLTDLWAKVFPYLIAGCASLALGSLALLTLIYKKKVLQVFYIALTGAGLTLLFPGIWLLRQNYANRLQIQPQYVKEFFVKIYSLVCTRLWITGAVLLGVGILAGVLAQVLPLLKKRSSGTKGEGSERTGSEKALSESEKEAPRETVEVLGMPEENKGDTL